MHNLQIVEETFRPERNQVENYLLDQNHCRLMYTMGRFRDMVFDHQKIVEAVNWLEQDDRRLQRQTPLPRWQRELREWSREEIKKPQLVVVN